MASRWMAFVPAVAAAALLTTAAGPGELWAPVYDLPATVHDAGRANLVKWAPRKGEVEIPAPPGAVLVGADFLGQEGVAGAPMLLFVASTRSFADVTAFYAARLQGLTAVDLDDGSRMYWFPQPGVDPLDAEPPVVTIFPWAGEVTRRKVPGARSEVSVYAYRQERAAP